jgi:hypothetical protein
MVTLSVSRAGLARPAPSEPYVQVSPHTAQASASAYGVDRGDRPGMAPAAHENAGCISGGRVAADHDVGIAALLEVRIEDCFAGRAPAPPVYLGESGIAH